MLHTALNKFFIAPAGALVVFANFQNLNILAIHSLWLDDRLSQIF